MVSKKAVFIPKQTNISGQNESANLGVKMKRYLILVLAIVVGIYGYLEAEPHWNNQTTFMAQDDGDSMRTFTVSIGTTTPVSVYYSTQTAAPARNGYSSPDRVVMVQNLHPFNLYCSTYSTVSATSGNRFVIRASTQSGNTFTTYSAPPQLWCIFDSPAGAGTREVLGWVGYDSQD